MADQWLGRREVPDDASLAELVDPELRRDLTANASRYGFHATLKPPFRVRDGSTFSAVHADVEALASGRAPVTIDALGIGMLGGFTAFTPQAPAPLLDELAQTCVTALDHHRAPFGDAELTRRRQGLTSRQDELLVRWGYPYVLDEFRFHMTLTRRLSDEEREPVLSAARRWFAPVDPAQFVVDALCVFEQPALDVPFVETARYPLEDQPIDPV